MAGRGTSCRIAGVGCVTSVNVAVILGIGLAIVFTFMGVRRMRGTFVSGPSATIKSRTLGVIPAALAVITFPFALWLGFVVGGTLGGSLGASVGEHLGAAQVLIPTGIAIGLLLTITVLCLAVAGIGYFVVRPFSR
jgi:hypothetical protein